MRFTWLIVKKNQFWHDDSWILKFWNDLINGLRCCLVLDGDEFKSSEFYFGVHIPDFGRNFVQQLNFLFELEFGSGWEISFGFKFSWWSILSWFLSSLNLSWLSHTHLKFSVTIWMLVTISSAFFVSFYLSLSLSIIFNMFVISSERMKDFWPSLHQYHSAFDSVRWCG